MKRISIFGVFNIFLVLIFISGCKNDFEPYEGSNESIMLFSILDTRSSNHKAWIRATDQNNTSDISKLEVYLFDKYKNSHKYTASTSPDGQYKTFSLNYDFNSNSMSRGDKYTLALVKDSITTESAEIYIPLKNSQEGIIFDNSAGGNTFYYAAIKFSEIPTGNGSYYLRFRTFIEYEINQDGKKTTHYKEIPHKAVLNSVIVKEEGTDDPFMISERGFNLSNFGFSNSYENYFSGSSYNYTSNSIIYAFRFIKNDYKAEDITIKRAFTVYQTCSAELYKQVKEISFDQSMILRFDALPYSTNMFSESGRGLGLFGAVTIDTVNLKITNSVITKFRYIDGQQ